MHRNWKAISKVKDPLLRILVATTRNERTMRGLRIGFPRLFVEEEPPDAKVGISLLRDFYEKHSNSSSPEAVLAHFELPYFQFGGGFELAIESRWRKKLSKTRGFFIDSKKAPVFVIYERARCLVAEYDAGTADRYLVLVPARFVDLEY
jgi:hypothetical protein